MTVDRSFGDLGGIWTAVPRDRRPPPAGWITPAVYYTGGTAVGLHLGSVGPTLAASGPSGPKTTPRRTEVFAVHFPPDGRPAAEGMAAGTNRTPVSPEATLLGACDSPFGGLAMLLHVGKYKIVTVDRVPGSSGQITSDVPIPTTWLFEPSQRGSVRLLAAVGTLVIASTRDDRLRVAALDAAGRPNLFTTRIHSNLLKGLTRLDVASVQHDIRGWLFIALTAKLDHPGTPSAAAILRVNSAGTRDPSYGEDGLWVSPPTPPKLRQFIAAGTWPNGAHHPLASGSRRAGGVVGIDRSQMVAIGVASDGDALDNAFASNGILRLSMGGGVLSSPVTVSSGEYTYLFAARHDGRVVGCRFNHQGVLDTGFGDAGLATVPSGAEKLAPADLKVTSTRLAVAFTRRVDGIDCDRVPGVVMLNPTTGHPDGTFGAGGFVFHAAVGEPAVVCPNGVAYYAERLQLGDTMTLRRTDPDGRFSQAMTLPAPIGGGWGSLFALEDSSVLVGSSAFNSALVGKLTPTGGPDASFGTKGLAIPLPGDNGPVQILGLRPDGKIAALLGEPGRLGVLDPTSGALDTTYGNNDPNNSDPNPTAGLVNPYHSLVATPYNRENPYLSTEPFPFLDADGSVLLAIASKPKDEDDNPAELVLQRITPSGMIDPGFGIGVPNPIDPPPSDRVIWPGHWRVEPVGVARIAGMLYVVAQGVDEVSIGGFEVRQFGTLIVTRWTAQGRVDSSFGTRGRQEAGHEPDMLDYKPTGVLVLPADEPMVAARVPDADRELIVFGTAGAPPTSGRPPEPRRPEPAFWRVTHPEGIEAGQPQFCQMQEFEATTVAARILPPAESGGRPRLRFVCADRREQPGETTPKSNFGGVGQFTIEQRPPRISLVSRLLRILPRP